MKKSFVFILLVVCITVFAATEVPAGNVSGNWDLAGSPYNINGEILIQAGETLTIDPGVTVNFTGHFKFNVEGTLTAVGTAGNEIVFTAADDVNGWHGIRFTDITTTGQDASQLVYCSFEYGRANGAAAPDYQGGAIYCVDSSDLTISYCSFNDNSATTGGTMYLQGSDITIQYVEITGSEASGAGGAIYLNDSDVTLEDSEITGNTSLYDGGGINCFNSDPVITRVIIAGNETQWNGGGVSVFNNSNPVMNKVTIVDNMAEQNGSGLACLYSSEITLVNSIIWDNAFNGIYVEPGTSLNATYSDLDDSAGQNYFGTGCIQQDPLFVNAGAGDYSLSWENAPTPDETMSPCIDTGDPDGDPDPDATIADMGAVYYPQTGIEGTVTLVDGTGDVSDVTITITLTVPPNTEYVTNPDAGGNYMISIPSGTYDLVAQLDGYSTYSHDDIEIAGGLVTHDIELSTPPPGELRGQVEVEGIGDPSDVLITANGSSTNPVAVYDGEILLYYQYEMELAPGTFDVVATLAGYTTQTEENVIVESGQLTDDIDFYLPLITNDGTISGTVTLVGGVGNVENVVISVGDETTNPAADGTYEIDVLNDTYEVTASLDGYSELTVSDVVVTAFQTTEEIDFALVDGWEQIDGTQYSMVVYATVTYDGGFMDDSGSNQLAAFGWDESGLIEECRGNAIWIPGNHFIWDGAFDLDGFWYLTIVSDNNSGTENIWFDFYNDEVGAIEHCNEMIFFDDGTFDTGINLTIDSPETDQTIDLVEGWNWVSFNRNPADKSVASVFGDLDDVPDVLQVKNQTSFAQYDPPSGLWVGALDDISYNEGYKINMLNEYNDFTVTGEKYNPMLYPINIVQGYNWLSYLPETEMDLATALQSMSFSDSTCIKTQSQSAVYFGGWIGDLQTMEPGKAYLLSWPNEITDALYLTYPPEEEVRDIAKSDVSNLNNWQLATGYESNMILMSQLSYDSMIVDDDQNFSAGIFDSEGNCRSIGKLQDGFWYFTIAGNRPELLEVRLFAAAANTTITAEESVVFSADSITGNPSDLGNIEFLAGEDIPDTPENLMLKANYPNPFNPTTMFSYALPQNGQVTLKLYNSKGQLVETLVNSYQEAGEYSINWNADNHSSGIYFYKLRFAGQQITRKCILMK